MTTDTRVVIAGGGIRTIVHGPITFTPDANPLVGPAFGLDNAWLPTGSSMGVMEGGGAGRFLADWLVDGAPPMDAQAVDPRRFGSYADRDYRVAKATECFGLQFGVHYPFEERPAGRPRRVAPIHEAQAGCGAVFGCVDGWERPNWFAPGHESPSESRPAPLSGVQSEPQTGSGSGDAPLTFLRPAWRDAVADQGAQASMTARNRSLAPGPRAKGLMMGRSRPEAR